MNTRRDPHDPQTWVCELWWPSEWHAHFYAADFVLLREFGQLLLAKPGAWRVQLHAADPVAQFVIVWHDQQNVAEVSVDSDQPVPCVRVLYAALSPAESYSTATEAVDALEKRVRANGGK